MTGCQAFPPRLLLRKMECMQFKITRMLDPPLTCTQLLQGEVIEGKRGKEKWVGARNINTVLKISSLTFTYVVLDSDQSSATDILLPVNALLVSCLCTAKGWTRCREFSQEQRRWLRNKTGDVHRRVPCRRHTTHSKGTRYIQKHHAGACPKGSEAGESCLELSRAQVLPGAAERTGVA